MRLPVTGGRGVTPWARALFVLVAGASFVARADEPLAADAILDKPGGAHLESLRVRFTQYEQDGHGFQSQADPMRNGAGSERLSVSQPQVEAVIRIDRNVSTRLWLPLDVITSASANAIDRYVPLDVMSSASRQNEAASLDSTTTWQADRTLAVQVRAGIHIEENFRSWNVGAGVQKSFAEDNTVVFASVNQVVDWFDFFDITGARLGHNWRSSTNANVGFTQLLSPGTVASINYGYTVQDRHLGLGWQSVPLDNGSRGAEILPELRQRHAVVGRLVQKLPWRGGSIKGSYRFYADTWGLVGHTVEGYLYQRLAGWLYLRGNYRFHYQTGVDFFTTESTASSTALRTADSDLAPLSAHSVGLKAVLDIRLRNPTLRALELDVGYERYMRSNDMTADIYACGAGFRF